MCLLCETNPVYEFTNKRKLCKNCFIKWFQKKILYNIRKYSMIEKGDIIYYKKGNNFRDVVLEEILKILSEKMKIKVINSKKFLADKVTFSNSIDLISCNILNFLIKKDISKSKNLLPISNKNIFLFYFLSDKEILLYAKLKKLKFNKIYSEKKDIICSKIENLEKKHPEVKRSIVNGFVKLYI
jgi:hypothetical protein